MDEKYLWKGNIVEKSEIQIDLNDRGYQFGDGIYEVVHIYHNHFFALNEHLDRLEASAAKILLNLKYSRQEYQTFFEKLAAANNISEGYVYLQVSRGDGILRNHGFAEIEKQEPVIIGFAAEQIPDQEKIKKGVTAITYPDKRGTICDVKSLNLLPNCLAKHEAQVKKVNKALLIKNGLVTEEKSGNVFIIKKDVVYTHPDGSEILPGITKKILIPLLKNVGIEVIERAVSLDELLNADEVIVTDTNSECQAVVEINGQMIGNGQRGPIAQKMEVLYHDFIKLECEFGAN